MVLYLDSSASNLSKTMFSGHHRQTPPFFTYTAAGYTAQQPPPTAHPHHHAMQQFQTSSVPPDFNCNQMWGLEQSAAAAQWHLSNGGASSPYRTSAALYDESWGSPGNPPTYPLSYYARHEDYVPNLDGSPDPAHLESGGGGNGGSVGGSRDSAGPVEPSGPSSPVDRKPPLPTSLPMTPPTSSIRSRSPYDWMKRPSYQQQHQSGEKPNGKTRTKDKYRVVYSDQQRLELEKEFHYSRYITIRRKAELATILGLSERQVKIWFQNRRAKERKQSKKGDIPADPLASPIRTNGHLLMASGIPVSMAHSLAATGHHNLHSLQHSSVTVTPVDSSSLHPHLHPHHEQHGGSDVKPPLLEPLAPTSVGYKSE